MKLSLHATRYMSIENPTLAHFRHFIRRGGFSSLFTLSPLYICRERSTNQLLFMQNKPNVKDAQINVNSYMKVKYEILDTWLSGKNKANSNPNKPNFKKAKMNVNLYVIEDYRKKDDFVVRINKPNFQNAKNERKLTYNKGLQKKRLFSRPKNKPKTNPILSAVGGFPKGQNKLKIKSLSKKSGRTRPRWPCHLRLTWQKANSTMEPFAQYVLKLGKHYARLMIKPEQGD